jgi:endonuclease YncB( thermonuclease family)
MTTLAALSLLAIATLALPSSSTSLSGVPRIVDGDTFEVDGVRVRLSGLHAPERHEPGGAEAAAFMRSLTAGQTVTCEISGGDRYGRAVAICYLPAGRDVAAELAAGYVAAGVLSAMRHRHQREFPMSKTENESRTLIYRAIRPCSHRIWSVKPSKTLTPNPMLFGLIRMLAILYLRA